MAETNLTRTLASKAATLDCDDLSEPARQLAGQCVLDRKQRAAQGLGTLSLEHAGEAIELAAFGEGNPAAG